MLRRRRIRRDRIINQSRRIVVKVGGSLLVGEGEPDLSFIQELVDSVVDLIRDKKEVVIVSSGAIALGKRELGVADKIEDPGAIPSKQALASIGQTKLIDLYSIFFKKYNLHVGQILLSAQDLSQRLTYLNARNTILTLLKIGAVPVVNENDTVAVEEIKFGDNDTLSALVAGLVNADLLIIISDVEGFYTHDPKKNPEAKLIFSVENIDEEVEKMANGSCAEGRVGGMKTKIEAAKIATHSGIHVIIGGGKDFLRALFRGEEVGTLFFSSKNKLQARKKWIAYGSRVKGKIVVDEGAKKALLYQGKSLLPVGIIKIMGEFYPGDPVSLLDSKGKEFARGITYYSSKELERIKGAHTREIEKRLGYKYYDEAVHRDNLVVL